MPLGSTCQMVVRSQSGLRRCQNLATVFIPEHRDMAGLPVDEVQSCQFHHENGNAPQCVDRVGLLRCAAVAVCLPIHDPQFCQAHGVAASAHMEAERNETRERTRAFRMGVSAPLPPGIQQTFTRDDIAETDVSQIFPRNEQAQRAREIADRVVGALSDEDEDGEAVEDLECLVLDCRNPADPGSEFCPEHRDCTVTIERTRMPSITISQTATPFVAALVERLGGEVTVPARRCSPAQGELRIRRVETGVCFSLVQRGAVMRTPGPTRLIVEGSTAPTVVVDRKIEIEKIFDEAAQEVGTTLIRCAECGLRYDRTFKGPTGIDECPICELRKRESYNRDQEIRDLRIRFEGAVETNRVQAMKAERLEQMVQQKLALISEQSTTIKGLRDRIREQSPAPAQVSTEQAEAPGKLIRIRNCMVEHRVSVSEAKRRVEEEMALEESRRPMVQPTPIQHGGLRERIAAVAREFGSQGLSHEMTTVHNSEGEEVERHRVTIVLPMRSQLEMGPEQRWKRTTVICARCSRGSRIK